MQRCDGRRPRTAGAGGGCECRSIPPAPAGGRCGRLPSRLQRTAGWHAAGRHHYEGEQPASVGCVRAMASLRAAQVGLMSLRPASPCTSHKPTVVPPSAWQVNMALKALPTFSCLPQDRGQHRTTTHLLPGDEHSVLAETRRAFADASAGRLPEFPTIEVTRRAALAEQGGDGAACMLSCRVWHPTLRSSLPRPSPQIYWQTTVDPTLTDAEGRYSAALFVQCERRRMGDATHSVPRWHGRRQARSAGMRFPPSAAA